VFYQKLKEEALHIAKEYYDKIIPMIPPLTEQEKKWNLSSKELPHL